jgi:hypothetical protein
MDDLAERLDRRGTHAKARAVRADQIGESRLDRGVPGLQRVIVGIADLGRVRLVVEPVVPGDLGREPGELPLGLGPGQPVGVGHGKGKKCGEVAPPHAPPFLSRRSGWKRRRHIPNADPKYRWGAGRIILPAFLDFI